MAPKSCRDAFLALKNDATKSVSKKRPRSDPTSGATLLFMTTSQRNLGDICSLTSDQLAVTFPNMDAITNILATAKEAKEAFMIQHESNPITGALEYLLSVFVCRACFYISKLNH
jgi:hypothetical protein